MVQKGHLNGKSFPFSASRWRGLVPKWPLMHDIYAARAQVKLTQPRLGFLTNIFSQLRDQTRMVFFTIHATLTHTHRHTHTHTHTHTDTHTHTQTHTKAQAHTQKYTHTNTHTQTHTDTHRHTNTHTHIQTHTKAHTHTHTHIHTHTLADAHMHTYAHAFAHVCCPCRVSMHTLQGNIFLGLFSGAGNMCLAPCMAMRVATVNFNFKLFYWSTDMIYILTYNTQKKEI